MNTAQPISFIYWGTEKYLKKKLDGLIDSRVIGFYMFIFHHAESDEKKDHFHVYAEPNGKIDTDTQFKDYFIQFDPAKPDKPIKPSCIRKSKFSDAYLYFIHDADYLLSKGQSRQYIYSAVDVVTSDADELLEKYHTIDISKIKGNPSKKIYDGIKAGVSFDQMVLNGFVPIQQIGQYMKAYELMGKAVNRNGRTGHDKTSIQDNETLEDAVKRLYGIDLLNIEIK